MLDVPDSVVEKLVKDPDYQSLDFRPEQPPEPEINIEPDEEGLELPGSETEQTTLFDSEDSDARPESGEEGANGEVESEDELEFEEVEPVILPDRICMQKK